MRLYDLCSFNLSSGEENDDDEHCPHQLFTEMDELRTDVDGVAEWKETARWVKFEEDVEEGQFFECFVLEKLH